MSELIPQEKDNFGTTGRCHNLGAQQNSFTHCTPGERFISISDAKKRHGCPPSRPSQQKHIPKIVTLHLD